MILHIIRSASLAMACCGLTALAGTEGHGGDTLRFQFEEGRGYAAALAMEAKACSLGNEVRPEVKDWIMTNKLHLASDIQDSQHVWITDPQATCAFTQTKGKYPITLSFVTCRSGIQDSLDAAQLLIHESVHHFDIVDESFADEVAIALTTTDPRRCNEPPPADSMGQCTGQPMSESEAVSRLQPGRVNRAFSTAIRQKLEFRDCYISGCGSWSSKDGVDFAFDVPGTLYFRTLWIYLRLVNNRPQVGIRWAKSGSSWWGAISPREDDMISDCGVVGKNGVLGCRVPELSVMHTWQGKWRFDRIPTTQFIGTLHEGDCVDLVGRYSVNLVDEHGNSLRREFRWIINGKGFMN